MTPPPLRVGVMLDDYTPPRWAAAMLRDIRSSAFADIALVIRNAAPPPARRPFGTRLRTKARALLYEWYTARDERRRTLAFDPFAPEDVSGDLTDVPCLDVRPVMTQHTDAFSDADVEAILAHQLDVVIRMGFRILKGRSLSVARYGVWSYHHGDNTRYRGGPPGFWEVYEDAPVTGTVLQRLTEALDAGAILYRSYGSTNRFSVRANREGYYPKAAAFVLRKLRDVYERGESGLRTHTDDGLPWTGYSQRLYVTPTSAEMVRFLIRVNARRASSRTVASFSREQWILGYQYDRAAAALADDDPRAIVPASTLYRTRPILPPADRFWADPFPIRVDGGYYVFLEELPWSSGRGIISVLEADPAARTFGPARPVLERPYHLSYPYLFRWRNELWMVPESSDARVVELYRARSFPDDWTREAVLLENVHAQDATLLEHGGRWWMFACHYEAGGASSDELYLYWADTPLGPWTSHPWNPVVSDVRRARPAGRPFVVDGVLYRPAQDCSRRYGYAMRLMRVEQLDTDGYRERDVSLLEPNWTPGLIATHTINAHAGLTMIDLQRRVPRWRVRHG